MNLRPVELEVALSRSLEAAFERQALGGQLAAQAEEAARRVDDDRRRRRLAAEAAAFGKVDARTGWRPPAAFRRTAPGEAGAGATGGGRFDVRI